MAWCWTIIQLLIHFTVSFSSCDIKMLHGIWYKIGGLNQQISQTYNTLSQEYFKSYRIAFRVAFWLDFEQLFSYLFVYRRLFRAAISKYYMEFDTNWRIESRDILFKLTTGYLKSISTSKEVLLGWLCGLFSYNYPVTYSLIGFFLYLRRKNITWNLSRNWRIESTDILLKLGKGYFKSISSHIE